MAQEEKKPVQVTIRAAGNHADRAAVQDVVGALRATLELPDLADTVTATIVVEITEHVPMPDTATQKIQRNSETGSTTRYKDRMRLLKDQYPRAYEPWNKAEEQRLRELHDQDFSIKEIATELQRQPGAIRSRLDRLQLAEQPVPALPTKDVARGARVRAEPPQHFANRTPTVVVTESPELPSPPSLRRDK